MKQLSQIAFALLITFTFACGAGKSDKTDETAKNDSSEAAGKESPEAEENEKPAEEVSGTQQVSEGTFIGIDQGDYSYFRIKPEAGDEKSFMVSKGDDTFEKIAADPDKFAGKKVRVTWEAKKQNIPEAGGEINVEEYVKVEILK